jgi:dipeptidyl aminopeptidase/acylaminoacyl peptidase
VSTLVFYARDFSSSVGGSAQRSVSLQAQFDEDEFVVPESGRFEGSGSTANALDATPWQDPLRFVQHSPVFFADRIRTPLLLMTSDFDGFPMGQSQEMFSALYRLRKDATLVTYCGEGHGNLSPANFRDAWRRRFDWFDRYLNLEAPTGQHSH